MKLMSFYYQNQNHLGCLLDEKTVVDLPKAYAKYLKFSHKTKVNSVSEISDDMLSFIQDWENSFPAAKAAFEWIKAAQDESMLTDVCISQSEIKINAPLSNPSKVVCVGLNYRDHCREHHYAIPERPLLFAKFPTSIVGPFDDISWPITSSQKVDYEAELAIVISKKCKDVLPEQALDYIAGFTVLNDISARDVQFSDVQWVRGKSFDTFCPFGPYLITTDEVPDPQNLPIRCKLNGKTVQDSNTKEMVFSCNEIISFISKNSTLLPGDLIATGTPDGVGSARTPEIYLHDGDTMEIEIEGIGRIQNTMHELS